MTPAADHDPLREAVTKEFTLAGYTEAQIQVVLDRQESLKQKDKAKGDKNPSSEPDRERWIKIHRRHIVPETLTAYKLPWGWDEMDDDYILIKEWISEEFQDELFEHSRRIQERRLNAGGRDAFTEFEDERMGKKEYMRRYNVVRKRGPSKKGWIYT
ncbi:hypothetical protein BDW59DRAFT_96766 [Aspergillus cavernicola]|uniref:DUF8035 domain-containing protein n=1 Tax=Aspergillus cavernicola TaxID=176166 RepID=A0ABR4I6W8_9EURO